MLDSLFIRGCNVLWIGFIGLLLVQGSALCQTWKFLKVKRVEGVSVSFWWTLLLGLGCYLIYSISIYDVIYIISNSVGVVLSGINIFFYYFYKRRSR